MSQEYNVYCDESCHLENDKQSIMVLGAIWCPIEKVGEISTRLRELKQKNNFPKLFEVKWVKVSNSKITPYLDFIDYFFDDDDLHFRALIANKTRLNHKDFNQTHDEWYYKMYFDMLKVIFSPKSKYRVYLDIKDTRGGNKVSKLHEVLCNNIYDFSASVIERVQIVRSNESDLMQLADLLIGAISYINRGLSGNKGKMDLIKRIQERSGYSLQKTTLFREDKVNLFIWDIK